VMAIPTDAPHSELAYKFIDFMLRPENIARVTNTLQAANAVPASMEFLNESTRDNEDIFPPEEDMEKLHIDIIQPAQYERRRSRAWTRIKTGR